MILFEACRDSLHVKLQGKESEGWTGIAMCVSLCSKATAYQKAQNIAAALIQTTQSHAHPSFFVVVVVRCCFLPTYI